MYKVMALDIGTKRIGVALSDYLLMLSNGHSCVPRQPEDKAIEEILNIAKTNNVKKIVVGVPFNMDGTITYKNFSTEEEIIYNDYEFSDGYLHLHNQQKDFDLYCDDYNNCFAGDGGIVYDKVY